MKRSRLLKNRKSRAVRLQRLTAEQRELFADREKALPRSFQVLKRKLLSLGGIAVVPRSEEEMAAILKRGQLFIPDHGYGYKFLRGDMSQCHENVSRLWKNSGGKVKIVSGWVLDRDGLWRQHTWGFHSGNIFETTQKRLKYYGAVLNEHESKRFYEANV